MLFTKKNIYTILLYGGATGITSLVPFFLLPILTKELSIADYGVLALIEVSVLFVLPFVSLKVEAGIGVEYFKLSQRSFKVYVINALLLSMLAFLVTVVVLFFFKGAIGKLISIEPFYILMLPVFALLRVVGAVLLTLFRSQQRPDKFFLLCLIQGLIDLSFSLLLVVVFKIGIDGRLIGVYFSLLMVTIAGMVYFFINGFFRIWSTRYLKRIMQYSMPIIPHAIAGFVIVMSDRYFLSHYFGAVEVGLYAVGYQISGVMLLVGTVINQFWSPQLYGYLKNKSYKEAKVMGTSISLFLLVSGYIIFFSQDYFYMILVDEKFYVSKPFFKWLLLGFIFQSLYFVVANYLFFYAKTVLLAKLTSLGAILNLVLNYVLIMSFSSIGVAYSTALTWLVVLTMVSLSVYFKKVKWEAIC